MTGKARRLDSGPRGPDNDPGHTTERPTDPPTERLTEREDHSVLKLRFTLPMALLCWALLASAGAPRSRAAEADDAKKDDKGWKKLFDGKTLKGWKSADLYKPGKVHVKDGAIVMDRGSPMTGATYAGKDFPTTDYEVTLEGKKIDGDDFFCTTTFPVGKDYCTLVVGGWSGTVVGLSNVDSENASANETRKDLEFKKGQWYRVRLRVSKSRIEAWIDKEKVVDLDTTDRRLSIRIECNASRPFGVATYRTTGAVRDVRVRSLTEAEKKAILASKPKAKDE